MDTYHLPHPDNLELYYKPLRCYLSFHKEKPQEIIFRNINISDIDKLIITDPETEEVSNQSEILTQYRSFYDLMMLHEDEYRYAMAKVFMKDGTIYTFDFNLSQIDCASPDKLFELASPIFKAYGYPIEEIRELIELSPMEHLAFPNGVVRQINFPEDEGVPF